MKLYATYQLMKTTTKIIKIQKNRKIRQPFVKNNHISWFYQNNSLYKLTYFRLQYYYYLIFYLLYDTDLNRIHGIVEQRTMFHFKGDIEYFITKPIIITCYIHTHTYASLVMSIMVYRPYVGSCGLNVILYSLDIVRIRILHRDIELKYTHQKSFF